MHFFIRKQKNQESLLDFNPFEPSWLFLHFFVNFKKVLHEDAISYYVIFG